MSNSVSDLRRIQLESLTGLTKRSIDDMAFIYYSSVSGLTPAAKYSLADHQRAYWKIQTGFDVGKSNIDLETIFLNNQGIAAGSIDNRRSSYYGTPLTKVIIDARLYSGADGDVVTTIPNQVAGSSFASITQATAVKKPLYRSANPNMLRYNQATTAIDVNTNDAAAVTNCSIARVALAAAYSGYCMQGTSLAAGDMQFGIPATAAGRVTVTASTVYTVFGAVGSAAISRTGSLRVAFYDTAGVFISQTDVGPIATGIGTLTNIVAQVTTPALTVYMRVAAYFLATAAIGEIHYVANLGVMLGTKTIWLAPVALANNQPVFQFDGVDDDINSADWFGNTFWPMSIYMVAYTSDITRMERPWYMRNIDGVLLEFGTTYMSTTAVVGATFRPCYASIAVINTPFIISGIHEDSGSIIRRNGTPLAKVTTAPGQPVWTSNTPMRFGSAGGSAYLGGGIAYFAAYQGVHTPAQALAIEQALGTSFGITVP